MNRTVALALILVMGLLSGCGKPPAEDQDAALAVPEIPVAGLTLAEVCPKCGGSLRPVPVQDEPTDPVPEAVRRGEAVPALAFVTNGSSASDPFGSITKPKLPDEPGADPWTSVCDACRLVRPSFKSAWRAAPADFRTVNPGEKRADNGLDMSFRWCPPGTFRRGSPPEEFGRSADENPVQVILTRGFWIGEFEVTQAQWKQVIGPTLREQRAKSGPIRALGDGSGRDHVGEGSNYPIYFVSHTDATEFCRVLNASERSAGRLPSGYEDALPTEAQWEYACRAGTTTITPYGDTLASTEANFDGNFPYNAVEGKRTLIRFPAVDDEPRSPPASKKRAEKGPYLKETAPVGSYKPNAWGIHDMIGNVWEWCRDGYAKQLGDGLDPVGPESSTSRVFRGGCWYDRGVLCRAAGLRAKMKPEGSGSGLGFRVALVATGR